MMNLNQLEGSLFSNPLEVIEDHQNKALKKTAQLHEVRPDYPTTRWGLLPPHVGGLETEKYFPSGRIEKETMYNPLLMLKYLVDPNIIREVGEHEGIHAGTPGKKLLSYLYYDSRDGYIKLGPMEQKSNPKYKYPVGQGIVEGGVKVISEKISGVEQTAYPISSEMAEKINKKLSEIDDKYSLVYIQKLAGITEEKLIQTNFRKFISNPDQLTINEIPKELNELLYIFNRPEIIEIVRVYMPKTDLFYVV